MINFRLLPKDFAYLGTEYNVVHINSENYKENIPYIEKTIQNFNAEIEWKDMFDLETAIFRFKTGMDMFIGVIDDEPFAHVWFDEYDLISTSKFLSNLFVKNKTENKAYTGKEFVSYIIHNYYSGVVIFCEVDDWNIRSIKLFEYLGFKKIK